jgi:hypothetical protein
MLVRYGARTTLLGSVAVMGLIGCAPAEPESTPPPAIVAAAQIPPLEVRVAAPTPQPAALSPPKANAVKPKPQPSAEPQTASAPRSQDSTTPAPPTPEAPPVAYEPPFPHRTDLFVPPKRAGGAASAQNAGENAVLLMGFVRVDQPKAVLSINGEIAPMAAGQSRFGVDVISISPPTVVLQRGRQRWQTTLE